MYSLEELDIAKTKILKYVLYKKRTEHEVREKFSDMDDDLLEDIIVFLKEEKYVDDKDYIRRCVNDFMKLNTLSIKEISYKLYQKGLNKSLVDEYICDSKEELLQYEINCAKKIILKKSQSEIDEVKNFLYRKGYLSETVGIAIDELE